MPEIEQFALDNYKALAERIGEKNIISFIAHCDEKSCHIHATITPILEDGRLSAKDMFGGSSLVAARDKMREWHDWYAAVNESSDMPWREKDEDYLHWAYRAMRYANAKHYPGNKLKKSKSYKPSRVCVYIIMSGFPNL